MSESAWLMGEEGDVARARERPEDWFPLFAARVARSLPEVTPPALGRATRRALGRSLARFQRGEAGEGRIAAEVARMGLSTEHVAAVRLFVKEEGRHARILKAAVVALGEQCLESHWSDVLFVAARRMVGGASGFGHKMAVLAAAEVIGAAYYRAVATGLGDSALRDALVAVVADEEDHLAFHRAHLRERPARVALAMSVAVVAAGLVVVDHRALFSRLGVTRRFVAGVAEGLKVLAGARART